MYFIVSHVHSDLFLISQDHRRSCKRTRTLRRLTVVLLVRRQLLLVVRAAPVESRARGVDGGVTATGVLSRQRGNLITIVSTR